MPRKPTRLGSFGRRWHGFNEAGAVMPRKAAFEPDGKESK